jgi:tRNA dimethylallyltransferase
VLLALVGPTASGKTEAGLLAAERLRAEVVSIDSMLVYRGMDIGTAKPDDEGRARVPHHLLDLAEPSERFTVARFQSAARQVLGKVKRPLLVGGSGLYFRAVVDDLKLPEEDEATRAELVREAAAAGSSWLHRRLAGLDPAAAAKIDPENTRRIVRALEVPAVTGRGFSSFARAWDRYDPSRVRAAGIRIPRDLLAVRIAARVDAMLAAGWLDEVRGLVDRGLGAWLTAIQAIGYSELAAHLGGTMSLDEARAVTIKRTKALARRQLAWFRPDPRIRWFDAGEGGSLEVIDDVGSYLGNVGAASDMRR